MMIKETVKEKEKESDKQILRAFFCLQNKIVRYDAHILCTYIHRIYSKNDGCKFVLLKL